MEPRLLARTRPHAASETNLVLRLVREKEESVWYTGKQYCAQTRSYKLVLDQGTTPHALRPLTRSFVLRTAY